MITASHASVSPLISWSQSRLLINCFFILTSETLRSSVDHTLVLIINTTLEYVLPVTGHSLSWVKYGWNGWNKDLGLNHPLTRISCFFIVFLKINMLCLHSRIEKTKKKDFLHVPVKIDFKAMNSLTEHSSSIKYESDSFTRSSRQGFQPSQRQLRSLSPIESCWYTNKEYFWNCCYLLIKQLYFSKTRMRTVKILGCCCRMLLIDATCF